jgi:hypothetical protein
MADTEEESYEDEFEDDVVVEGASGGGGGGGGGSAANGGGQESEPEPVVPAQLLSLFSDRLRASSTHPPSNTSVSPTPIAPISATMAGKLRHNLRTRHSIDRSSVSSSGPLPTVQPWMINNAVSHRMAEMVEEGPVALLNVPDAGNRLPLVPEVLRRFTARAWQSGLLAAAERRVQRASEGSEFLQTLQLMSDLAAASIAHGTTDARPIDHTQALAALVRARVEESRRLRGAAEAMGLHDMSPLVPLE